VLGTSEHTVLFISKQFYYTYKYCYNYLSSYFVDDRVCTSPKQLMELMLL